MRAGARAILVGATAAVFSVGLLGAGGSLPQSATRALVRARATPAAESLYRESWAVIIGIDAYRRWPRLTYAAADARAIRELLVTRFQFQPSHVTLLLDEQATKANILEALGDRLDQRRVHREDRVFVFFAGHGATRALPNGGALGYIIPVDADLEHYTSTAISMTNFRDISDQIPAKHVLFVIDACYGGLALMRGGSAYRDEVTRRVARQMLTAGGANEQVADNGPRGHSIFTWTLLQALEGRADANRDGYVTASEIYAFVGPGVSELSKQTPAFGWMAGSEGGDFVFTLPPQAELLDDQSAQLDDEAIRLNAEIERLRAEVAEKQRRNEKLKSELSSARSGAAPAPPPPAPPPVATPRAAAAASDRGMALFRERRYAEALVAFQEAAALAPGSVVDVSNAGYMYYKLGKYDEAVQWLQRAIALDPGRAITYGNLGYSYIGLKRYAEARAALRKYLALRPTGKTADMVRTTLKEIEGK